MMVARILYCHINEGKYVARHHLASSAWIKGYLNIFMLDTSIIDHINVIVYKCLLFTSIRQLIIDASEEEKTLDHNKEQTLPVLLLIRIMFS